jgi:hypothetical protein
MPCLPLRQEPSGGLLLFSIMMERSGNFDEQEVFDWVNSDGQDIFPKLPYYMLPLQELEAKSSLRNG